MMSAQPVCKVGLLWKHDLYAHRGSGFVLTNPEYKYQSVSSRISVGHLRQMAVAAGILAQ